MVDHTIITKQIGDFLLTDKEIGRGSFGSVYLGISSKDPLQQVAVKVLPVSAKIKEEINRNFYEIKILTSLSHQNLVKLIYTTKTNANLYLIFEYCKDGNLDEYCKNQMKRNPYAQPDRPSLTEFQAINFFKQIVAGYFHLYQHKIIHRDLKPQNIFLHAGCLKIGDFGLAKQFSSQESMLLETKCGSPLYMAPEVHIRDLYDNYCDMWSLGIIFYEMLYGKTPWTGFSTYNLVENQKKLPLEFPDKIVRNEPAKNLLKRILKLDPTQRIKWEEFFREVDNLTLNESINVKGNLIQKNIKIFDEKFDLEEFKQLDINGLSPQGTTPKSVSDGISILEESFDKINLKSPDIVYEKIQNGKDYIFYHRNVAAFVRKINGILIDLFRKHILSITTDLFYKLTYVLTMGATVLMKNLLTVCMSNFIDTKDLSKEFFNSNDFKQIKKEIEEDCKGFELEMEDTEESIKELMRKWMTNDESIIQNIEFISLVKEEKNLNLITPYFKNMFESIIQCFLSEQYDLLKEELIEDVEILRLLRYLQICQNLDKMYDILKRIPGEDNSQIFFSLYEYIENATKQELKKILKTHPA